MEKVEYPICRYGEPRLTSYTLFEYLLLPRSSDFEFHHFDKNLDLSYFRMFFEELQQQERKVFVQPDELRDLVKGNQEMEDLLNDQAPAERSTVIYYDPETQVVSASEPIHGEYGTTIMETTDILSMGKFPLIEVHTHPENSLFSPQDYIRLVVGNPNRKRRFIRGAVVLCPDMQILALPTNLTPIITPDAIPTLIEQWDQLDPTIDKKLQLLSGRIIHVGRAHSNEIKKILDEISSYGTNLPGPITEEETRVKMEELTQKAIQINNKTIIVGEKVAQQYQDYKQSISNRQKVDHARNLGIKLYCSTNFSDFKEFSA